MTAEIDPRQHARINRVLEDLSGPGTEGLRLVRASLEEINGPLRDLFVSEGLDVARSFTPLGYRAAILTDDERVVSYSVAFEPDRSDEVNAGFIKEVENWPAEWIQSVRNIFDDDIRKSMRKQGLRTIAGIFYGVDEKNGNQVEMGIVRPASFSTELDSRIEETAYQTHGDEPPDGVQTWIFRLVMNYFTRPDVENVHLVIPTGMRNSTAYWVGDEVPPSFAINRPTAPKP